MIKTKEKKMDKLTIKNTGKEGKYCFYEIEYKEKNMNLLMAICMVI